MTRISTWWLIGLTQRSRRTWGWGGGGIEDSQEDSAPFTPDLGLRLMLDCGFCGARQLPLQQQLRAWSFQEQVNWHCHLHEMASITSSPVLLHSPGITHVDSDVLLFMGGPWKCFLTFLIIFFNFLFFSFFKIIFFFFYFTILYWFCHTSTCIHHGCTHVPHPEAPSHLPPHTIPLGHPSAPAPSFLYPASNLDWWFFSYMILYMF